ncbi:unnamed protein product [Caenorhabditis auriculariae]|uniref:GPS domain-containing protein n=1 Tax=Caenorhabditis auriculariae TaxID=2777116 RepID=A0A8S1HQK4_9PELO|nr:unnamed protein product [Caenorhabditis auriculariae]
MFRVQIYIFLAFACTTKAEEVHDVRIHEGAEKGSRMTMSAALQAATEPYSSCFGQLDTEVEWIEWRSSRGAFYTASEMPLSVTKSADQLNGTLMLLCANQRTYPFMFRIHVTHPNHHPPHFGKPSYHFHVPITLTVGSTIAKLEVTDHDPVIYNSERSLAFTKDEPLFGIEQDGSIIVKKPLSSQLAYVALRTQVLAIDYGSPQLFTIANVSLTPVTVSEVRDARVNVARSEYQIFEWDVPGYGRADKFRLTVRRHLNQTVYEEEVDGTRTVALTKMKLSPSESYTFRIVAIDVNGETPSEWLPFGPLHHSLSCDGECSRGGVPLCFHGPFNRVEQFVDSAGAHCQCFPGYVGVSCDRIDQCAADKTVETWGGVDWSVVHANTTLRLPCPYNQPQENQYVERRCSWDEATGRAIWMRPKERDRCNQQTSVLTHLGMMGTFTARATTVSAINTVVTFVQKLLTVPAFVQDGPKYAHFDQKIAEMAIHVLDSIVQNDIDRLDGNTTLLKEDAWRVVERFSRSLPTPYSLASADLGIHMKSIQWIKKAEVNDNMVGKMCRVQLPPIDVDLAVRLVCASNATLFELLEPKSPVLSVFPDGETKATFSRMSIFLRFPDTFDNYTCVSYDEEEKAWSTKGIRRIDNNYHGYVKCETNHFGVFALLPDRLFYNSENFWKDLSSHMPTATSFVTLICTILLLFMAAVQKNQPIDCAFLMYLFYVFMIHLAHLLLFIAPQVGEPFAFSSTLHFVLQFCVIASAGLLVLVLYSVYKVIISSSESKDDDATCFSRPFHVVFLGVGVPLACTVCSYIITDGREVDILSIVQRTDWVFIIGYLFPTALLFSVCVAVGVWNVYIGSTAKSHRRGTSERFLSLGPAISASLTSLFMIFFLCSTILLFFFREESSVVVTCFCITQLAHVICAFFFASFLFRVRFLLQCSSSSSTESLERKRDISRALLDHVDTKSNATDGGFTEAGFGTLRASFHAPPDDDDFIPTSNGHGHFLTHNIFQRAPMVSIV